MKEKIIKLMMELVSLKSLTGTADENLASDYIYKFIRNLDYFKMHPEYCGNIPIEDDSKGRHIPYCFIRGKSGDTVILSGHFDVVDEADYGEAKEMAFTPGKELEMLLARNKMSKIQSADMKSGEWIWGKGTADMKGGVAIDLALVEEYSNQALKEELKGSVLFMAVPDEESYSAGMRYGTKLLAELKKEYHLEYKLLLNPEPTDLVDGKQIMYLGSVGKTMPVVMVQGITSHIGHCFDGLNPLGILAGIYQRTNGSLDFVDSYENEATMPPTWLKMRDLKETYDVSIPARASGYFTVLSLSMSPDQILEKLKKIAEDVCHEEIQKYEATYKAYKNLNKFEKKEKLGYVPIVYTFNQLVEKIKSERGTAFSIYYEKVYKEMKETVISGQMNYPDATEYLMGKVLDFANIKEPVVLLAFAPPYYPAVNSNQVHGKEETASKVFQVANEISTKLGQPLDYQNFFMGISDNSYGAVPSGVEGEDIVKVTPLWGDIYSIDFMSIWNVNVPAVIYGPVGRDYHKWAERVNRDSLVRIVPETTHRLIQYGWEL